METWTLTARWIFPVDRPPLERGTVTIGGDRIVSVERHGERLPDVDLGDVAILPGLVNAHTHLDLSGLRGKLQPGLGFTQWLRGVVQHRRSLAQEQAVEDVKAGIAESVMAGTTLIGDISSQGWSWPILTETPLRSVVFYELIGLSEARAEQAAEEARGWLATHPPTANCRPALSPHAPYSVRASLFQATVELARRESIPLASHLGESLDEIELLQHRRGPLMKFLSDFGVWEPAGLIQDLEEVFRYFSGIRNVLYIHANYLSNALASCQRQSARANNGSPTVIYCPRTHAAFGHPPHPFRQFLSAGIRVALGTDSLASNPDLNILSEARFLHTRFPGVSGAALLRMISLSGAESLGWDKETGSLEPGKSADLVALSLPRRDCDEPHDLVFDSDLPVRQLMWQGRWILKSGDIPGNKA